MENKDFKKGQTCSLQSNQIRPFKAFPTRRKLSPGFNKTESIQNFVRHIRWSVAKMANGFQPLTIFAKCSILDI